MARSAAQCAADRAAMYDKDIRAALAAGRSSKALQRAADFLLAEAKKLREERPGDGWLTDADLAFIVHHLAAGLHAYEPPRPRGCPRVPRPVDLLAVYEDAQRQAAGGEAG
jgi:hypothetical protein